MQLIFSHYSILFSEFLYKEDIIMAEEEMQKIQLQEGEALYIQ